MSSSSHGSSSRGTRRSGQTAAGSLLFACTASELRTIVANAASGEEAITQLRERCPLESALDRLPTLSYSQYPSVALLQSEHAALVRSTMESGEALTTLSYKNALIKAVGPGRAGEALRTLHMK